MTTVVDFEVDRNEAPPSRAFTARRPLPELAQRWAALSGLVLIGILAVILGLFFQRHSEMYRAGRVADPVAFRLDVDRLLVYGEVALAFTWAALMLWSATAVANVGRVCRSLRSVWLAVAGWLLLAVGTLVVHVWLDSALKSGMVLAGATFLALLYVPDGTIGGAAQDVGGSAYLARVWYLLVLLATMLLWAALIGRLLKSVLATAEPSRIATGVNCTRLVTSPTA